MKTLGADYMCPQIVEVAGQLEFAATAGNGRAVRELVGKLGSLVGRIRLTPPVHPAAGDEEAPLVSELLQEGPEMAGMVQYFLGRLPGYVQALKDGVAAGDLAALRKQAHDLKAVAAATAIPGHRSGHPARGERCRGAGRKRRLPSSRPFPAWSAASSGGGGTGRGRSAAGPPPCAFTGTDGNRPPCRAAGG